MVSSLPNLSDRFWEVLAVTSSARPAASGASTVAPMGMAACMEPC